MTTNLESHPTQVVSCLLLDALRAGGCPGVLADSHLCPAQLLGCRHRILLLIATGLRTGMKGRHVAERGQQNLEQTLARAGEEQRPQTGSGCGVGTQREAKEEGLSLGRGTKTELNIGREKDADTQRQG